MTKKISTRRGTPEDATDSLTAGAERGEAPRTHTPGPWSLDATRMILGKDFTGQWKAITDRVRGGSPMQADANARLIAAAPELLATLQRLVDLLNEDLDPEQAAAWDAAVAAIAKAKGETS